ncbi:MAG: F0F1 ATP synthase subunit delta [Christensenellales bacterium]|jgi:F-type H+-transporting ATPase subunit delta
MQGVVTTAVAVDEATFERICRKMEQVTGIKPEAWVRKVDPQIMGGFVVRIGDQLVDMSVKAQLDQVREGLN